MLLDRIGPPVEVPRVNPSCHPYARARARPWSARCYGVARQRDRSRQNSRGARACFSPAFPSARGCRRIWRGVIWFMVSRQLMFRRRDAARGDRAAWAVPRVNPFVTLTRARGPGRGRPVATGSLANAIGRAKTAEGLGRASLRHFGLARGCRGIWRGVISVYWFRGELRFIGFGGAMLLEGIGPPARCPALTPLVTLTRARGPGRGRPVATGSLANAIGRAKTAEGLGRASLRHFGLARGCRGIWRGVISVYWFRGELRFIGFGGAMLLERIGPPGRCPRVNPSCHPYARARARPWSARCYGVARQRDRSRQNSRGARACFSPAFRRVGAGIWRGVISV